MSANAEAQSAAAPEVLPPVAPPVSLYANLPQEWPLARLSVQLRHIGVLLRVTLYRRLAELSFRGVAFCQLPREVMKDICQDFDNICGEMANRLASLFAFLKPTSANANSDPTGQSLYADPGFWLYGLLSFCAKACETKTAEAKGAPAMQQSLLRDALRLLFRVLLRTRGWCGGFGCFGFDRQWSLRSWLGGALWARSLMLGGSTNSLRRRG